jgi:hypothetical protein
MPTDPHPSRPHTKQPKCSVTGRFPRAQRLVNRRAELLGGERLDQAGGELDAKLRELGRGAGHACANQRQCGIDYASSLRQHSTSRRRRLDHQHIGALQLYGCWHPYEHRLVTEAGDHALKQSPDVIVRLANQYLCHASMIDRPREIQGAQTV